MIQIFETSQAEFERVAIEVFGLAPSLAKFYMRRLREGGVFPPTTLGNTSRPPLGVRNATAATIGFLASPSADRVAEHAKRVAAFQVSRAVWANLESRREKLLRPQDIPADSFGMVKEDLAAFFCWIRMEDLAERHGGWSGKTDQPAQVKDFTFSEATAGMASSAEDLPYLSFGSFGDDLLLIACGWLNRLLNPPGFSMPSLSMKSHNGQVYQAAIIWKSKNDEMRWEYGEAPVKQPPVTAEIRLEGESLETLLAGLAKFNTVHAEKEGQE